MERNKVQVSICLKQTRGVLFLSEISEGKSSGPFLTKEKGSLSPMQRRRNFHLARDCSGWRRRMSRSMDQGKSRAVEKLGWGVRQKGKLKIGPKSHVANWKFSR